ncbi:MAG: hypothetical protein R2799_05325 [Crocinitomicaceae bacterium]
MDKDKSIEQINEIRRLMEGSSKFLSLSGMSGVSAGIIASLSSLLAYFLLYTDTSFRLISCSGSAAEEFRLNLILLAVITLGLALLAGAFFTYKKVQKRKESLISRESIKLLSEIAVPLGTGGLVLAFLYYYGVFGLMAPLTLIFYGLALFTASKYTVNEIRYLALCEIVLGLCSLAFIGYGLLFWWIGFGLLHIIYGIFIHMKYDKNS